MGLIINLSDVIVSRENNKVKYAVKLLISAKFRSKQNSFIIEGFRLCKDAVLSNIIIKHVLFTKNASIKYKDSLNYILNSSENISMVSEDIIKIISNTENPQGIVCICSKPSFHGFEYNLKIFSKKNILALEDINDPSNMGTILRTAEAFGFNYIILSENCCDIYSPKVLRGSMGAVFRLSFNIVNCMPKTIETFNQKGFISCASVPDREAELINNIDFKICPHLILIGNEANGLKKDTIKACKKKVTIPMPGRAESLNAAMSASVIMWEMVR